MQGQEEPPILVMICNGLYVDYDLIKSRLVLKSQQV